MIHTLKHIYSELRRRPVLGSAVSHLVWTVKGVLGLPVTRSAPAPRAAPQRRDQHERHALEVQLLRLIATERITSPLASPSSAPPHQLALSPTSDRPAVSVVVNTLNRAETLKQTLMALLQQRYPRFEIIVVHGPSTDHTTHVLASFSDRVRIVACAEANLALSRNIGISEAAGGVVAFIDDDAAPEPDWLGALMAPFADRRVAGVGGFTRDRGGRNFQCRIVVCDRLAREERFDALAAARLRHSSGAARYLSLTGTNAAFRRTALVEIGGFDAAYAYFLDETDVCLRLMDAGHDLASAPEAEVHHSLAASALREQDGVPIRLYPSVFSTAYFAIRHGLPQHGAKAVAAHLASYGAALKGYRRAEAAAGLIDPNRHKTLIRDIDQGLIDGVRAGFQSPRRAQLGPPPTRAIPKRPSAPDRLRLCLLSQTYGRAGAGGIAVWTEALAQGLVARGHEVTVITRTEGEASVAYRDGVWVHALSAATSEPAGKAAWAMGLPRAITDPAKAAYDEARRIQPRRAFDLVLGPIWDLEPLALQSLSPIPTVVSLHTTYAQSLRFHPEWARDSLYRARHVNPVIAGERRLLAAAPLVLANSRSVLADLTEAYHLPDLARCAVIIPHGLPDLAKGVAPEPPRPGVEVLFVGRLEPRKGIDILLEAALRVLAEAPAVRFVIVGEDVATPGEPLIRERFMQRVAGTPFAERIAFLGRVSQADVLRRYAAADLVVAPSRYESFGLTLVEAMIFKKPCIATAVGGMTEVARDGETGPLIPPDNPTALAQAILTLARNPDLRRRMGEAGRRRYEALFTADQMAQATQAAFLELKRRATHAPSPTHREEREATP